MTDTIGLISSSNEDIPVVLITKSLYMGKISVVPQRSVRHAVFLLGRTLSKGTVVLVQ